MGQMPHHSMVLKDALRFGDKKQTRRQNMTEIVFSLGVSEIKCIII